MAGGERIDRYEIESVLGSGAFATVLAARDPVTDLPVAIKVLADNWNRDPGIRARFIDEGRVLLQAESRRIVRVHHVGELPDGRPYLVMARADRGTLRGRMSERFASGAAFSVAEATSIVAELARAVADVHDLGRIHRDVKPSNVLIRRVPDGPAGRAEPIPGLASDEQLVLGDFGLARPLDASAATMVSGSPAYVAPEQAMGHRRLDERVDIYPLGLILIELVTGSSPAIRTSLADAALARPVDVVGHLQRAATGLPPAVLGLAQAMVDPDPQQRPRSGAGIARELTSSVVGPPARRGAETLVEEGGGATTEPAKAGAGRSGRRPALVGAILALVTVAAVGAGLVLRPGGATGEDPGETTTPAPAGAVGAAPETDQTSPLAAEPPTPVPLPAASRPEPGSDEIRTVANVALPVEEVSAFYEMLDDEVWAVVELQAVDDGVEIVLEAPLRTAQVTVTPTARSVGQGITRIEILYRDR